MDTNQEQPRTRQVQLPGGDKDYNISRLDEELRAAIPGFAGVSFSNGQVFISLMDSATKEEEQTALGMVKSHNPAEKAAQEIAEEARQADLDELRTAKLAALIKAIQDDEQAINAVLTNMPGALTVLVIRPILVAILAVMLAILHRQLIEIHALRRLAD